VGPRGLLSQLTNWLVERVMEGRAHRLRQTAARRRDARTRDWRQRRATSRFSLVDPL
jgi:hypothetical protein